MKPGIILFLFLVTLMAACSFDYGSGSDSENTKPDIVMVNLEYVRVRGGDPLVRFQAEYAERWENNHTMLLREFSFEQLENYGQTVNAEGRAGAATVELNSGNVDLNGGVFISVESEDITIGTSELQWKDEERLLSGGVENEVMIHRSDGTNLSGLGFSVDARNWTWSFSGEVRGTYIDEDEE